MSVKWMGWNGMDMREALRAGRKVLIPLKAPPDTKCARPSRSTPGCLDVHTHSRRFPGGGDSRLNDRTRKSLSLRRWLCRVEDVAPQFGQAKRQSQEITKPVETRHLQTIHEGQAGNSCGVHAFVRLHVVCKFATATSTNRQVIYRWSHRHGPD